MESVKSTESLIFETMLGLWDLFPYPPELVSTSLLVEKWHEIFKAWILEKFFYMGLPHKLTTLTY